MSSDQLYFYDSAESLSRLTVSELFRTAFSERIYSETPLACAYFGLLVKIGKYFAVSDTLLFVKMNTAFLGGMIMVVIYNIVQIYRESEAFPVRKQILWFSLLSPILLLSCQMMRDIHVCLLYAVGFYLALNTRSKFRWIWLVVCYFLIFFLRVESGLLFLLIIFLAAYVDYRRGGFLKKTFLFVCGILFCMMMANLVISTATNTLTGYTERSILQADSSSLGVLLNKLPFPLDYLSKAVFGQLLPFPLWVDVSRDYPYSYMWTLEMLFPVVWLAVWFYLLVSWLRHRTEWRTELKVAFYVCIFGIIALSASEFNTRRIMVVYPMLFALFLILRSQHGGRMARYFLTSFVLLLLLHLVYLGIK